MPILQHLSWIIRNTPSFSFLMNFRGVLAKDHLFFTHPVVSIIIHIFACAQVPTRSLPVHIKHPGHRCSGYQYNEEELGSLQLSMRRKQEEIFQIEWPLWNKHNPYSYKIKIQNTFSIWFCEMSSSKASASAKYSLEFKIKRWKYKSDIWLKMTYLNYNLIVKRS